MRTASGSPRTLATIRNQAKALGVARGGTKAEICSRITRRLRQKTTSRRRSRSGQRRSGRKACTARQIRNPATGRCVKRTGKIGQALRQRSRSRSRQRQGPKPCTARQIRNPATGRCVKRSGKIGQALRQRSYSARSPSVESSIEMQYNFPTQAQRMRSVQLGEPLVQPVQPPLNDKQLEKFVRKYGRDVVLELQADGYYVSKKLGAGAFGEVYLICKNQQDGPACNQVIKLQEHQPDEREDIRLEEAMHKLFAEKLIAPEFISRSYTTNTRGKSFDVIRMSRVDGLVENVLEQSLTHEELNKIHDHIVGLVKIMEQNNLTHGDMHVGNIAFYDDGEPELEYYLIDFGMSHAVDDSPELEYVQCIRGLMIEIYNARGNNSAKMKNLRKNSKYLIELFKGDIRKLYGNEMTPAIERAMSTLDRIDVYHDRLHHESMRERDQQRRNM